METVYVLLVAWLMSSTALGVGSSTLAIASFLTALKDGQIEKSERQMLGVIYTALRVAMMMIFLSLGALTVLYPGSIQSAVYLWILLGILTLNSILMTKHWISYKLGPALQAATWYTLGFKLTIEAFSLLPVTWVVFTSLYVVDIVIAVLAVNALLWWFKRSR